MSNIFMNKQEREIIDSAIDEGKFWVYGDKEACFRDDAIAMILQGIRESKNKS